MRLPLENSQIIVIIVRLVLHKLFFMYLKTKDYYWMYWIIYTIEILFLWIIIISVGKS